MRRLEGRKVLLTGGSRGLGAVLAQRLAEEGAELALVARSAEGLTRVAGTVERMGGVAHVLRADLCDDLDVAALPGRAIAALGRVDTVIHNAAIEPFGAFEEADPHTVRQALKVNLETPVQLTRALVPHLAERGGHVLFMGSTAGLWTSPYAATYGATKAAVASLARSLDLELADRGISVGVVQPGFVRGAGMFHDATADRGLTAPRQMGSTTVDAVASAVLDALDGGPTDVVVNSTPMRLGVAVALALPRMGRAVARRAVLPFMRRLAVHDGE